MRFCRSQSQSHVTTEGQLVSQSRCQTPHGAKDQISVTVAQLGFADVGSPL
jgi:hypothetical protein